MRRALRVLISAAIAITALAAVLGTLVDTFRATLVIDPREFPAGMVLDAHQGDFALVFQIGGALVLLLASADFALRLRASRARGAGRLGIAGMAVVILGQALAYAHFAGTMLTAFGLLAAFMDDEARALGESPREAAHMVGHLGWAALRRAAPAIFLLPALGFALCTIVELALYTDRFAGELFSMASFGEFVLLALGAAFLTGLRISVEIIALLLLMRFLLRGLPARARSFDLAGTALVAVAAHGLFTFGSCRGVELAAVGLGAAALRAWLRGGGSRGALVLALGPAYYFGTKVAAALFQALGDELAQLGLSAMAYAICTLMAIAFAAWTQLGLRAIFGRYRPAGRRTVVTGMVLAFADPLLALLAPLLAAGAGSVQVFLRRAAWPALAFLGAIAALLVELNYPLFTDFSQVGQVVYSLLLGFTASLFLHLVLVAFGVPRLALGRRAQVAIAGVFLLAALAYAATARRQLPRMIGAQYAKIAARTIELARVLSAPALFGLGEGDRPFDLEQHRLRRMERFPGRREVPELNRLAGRRPMILFVLWDAARADHLSAYGYERDTSPAAAALARESIVFRKAYANATATTASMRHLFSGRFSSRYMLERDHAPYFTGELVAAGYDLLILNGHGSDYNGVSEESFYRNQPNRPALERAARFFSTYEEQAKNRAALALLDSALAERGGSGEGIFIYLHCAATHYPWSNWPDHPIYGEGMCDRYDNSIGHADKALGDLLAALRARGLYEDLIVILTADHGTGLGEHGIYGGFQPYEEQIHVPLIMRIPGFAPRVVDEPVAGIDLAPTLVSLLRPGAINPYDGFSLVALMAGRRAHLERRFVVSLCAFEDALALIDLRSGYKLHLHRLERYLMLFDLRADPRERANLADREPARLARCLSFARAFLWRGRRSYANPYHYRAFDPR